LAGKQKPEKGRGSRRLELESGEKLPSYKQRFIIKKEKRIISIEVSKKRGRFST